MLLRSALVAVLLVAVATCRGSGQQPGPVETGDAGPTADAGGGDGGTIPDGGGAADAGTPPDAGTLPDGGAPDGGAGGTLLQRPYHLKLPAGYAPGTPAPLVLMFHGYGSSGAQEESYLRLSALSDEKGFIYVYADGTVDPGGMRFWNATDACCDLYGIPVDDVAYVSAILDDVQAKYAVDPKRIFVVGHSNGGFLAHRLACDLSGRIAGIVSLAGATWSDASKCKPVSPVAVLQIHGDQDNVILYGGGRFSPLAPAAYPSAHQTVATWGALDGCGALVQTTETLDLDSSLAGAETGIERYPDCRGGAVELWTIHGGSHIPSLTAGWAEPVWSFLSAHPKP